MATKSQPPTDASKVSVGRGAAKASTAEDASKRKKSSSHVTLAPNLPAFAYQDANPSRHIGHMVGTQSRQGSIEDLVADKTNERSHSRLSQTGKQGPPAQPPQGGSTDGHSSTTNKS
ncbi:hypothetical protein MRX96_028428 [Rhipicephalus microplus]